jgi:Arc/MetJ family transcription regulator
VKTTIDIPEEVLEDAMKFTHASTKRDAVVTALTDYNRRQRMAALTKHLGTCSEFITADELKTMRESN